MKTDMQTETRLRQLSRQGNASKREVDLPPQVLMPRSATSLPQLRQAAPPRQFRYPALPKSSVRAGASQLSTPSGVVPTKSGKLSNTPSIKSSKHDSNPIKMQAEQKNAAYRDQSRVEAAKSSPFKTKKTEDVASKAFIFDDLADTDATAGTGADSIASGVFTAKSWQTVLQRNPHWLMGFLVASLLVCAAFAGLGYLWVLSHNLPSDLPPVSMLGLQEPQQEQQPASSQSDLNNLRLLQEQNKTLPQGGTNAQPEQPPEPSEDPNSTSPKKKKTPIRTLMAEALPSQLPQMLSPKTSMATTMMTVEDIKRNLKEPSGRPDPFAPLVRSTESSAGALFDNGGFNEKRDVLMDVQYTGFVGDIHSKDKVAILKIGDPVSGAKTVIKKVGDSFIVEGERAVIKGISKNMLQLTVSGEARSLPLRPYEELGASSSSGASVSGINSSGINASGGGGAGASGNNAGERASGTASGPGSSTGGSRPASSNSNILKLQEM